MEKQQATDRHIILIGFKHSGKTTIGQALASKLARNFFDLDQVITELYQEKFAQILSCRQIMQTHGQAFFRDLEQTALEQLIQHPPAVIALGGGAVLRESNQHSIAPHYIIHVTAQPDVVFTRIMAKGQPAFFSVEEPPILTFNRLWQERNPVYRRLAHFSIDNSGSLALGIEEILIHLQEISL